MRGPGRRWVLSGALCLGGLALILAALPGRGSEPADVGSLPWTGKPAPSEQHARHPKSVPETGRPTPPSRWGDLPVRSGLVARYRAAPRGAVPVRLHIPRISVQARVLPVGVDPGSLAATIPEDVSVVGWYRFGPAPGDPGSTVLVGHVDARDQGPGALFHLSELSPGDAVVVGLSDGSTERYRVVARREYVKSSLPGWIFRRSGRSVLAMITCGGPFDSRTRHYRDNVVVYAVRA